MRFEWLVGTRYLAGSRNQWAPSSITIISVSMIALGVALLVLVLGILGGFEGDLRNKILGTKAHLLITGPNHGEMNDYDIAMEAAMGVEGVVGASGFVESDVMIASSTNYSGIVLRGIVVEEALSASELGEYMQEGDLDWLHSPNDSIDAADSRLGEIAELQRMAEELRRESEALEAEVAEIDEAHQRLLEAAEGIGRDREEGSGDGPDALEVLPEVAGEPDRPRRGPPSLNERLNEFQDASSDRAGGPPSLDDRLNGGTREIPGVVIGAELRDTLHVRIGDQVQIINPDGDLGPTGPIPRARPYRVVGIFYSGLYEYDNTMVYTTLGSAREFLNVPDGEVTGVELRIEDLRDAESVGFAVESAVESASETAEVHTWMELNERLFSALELEQFVIGLLLMFIVLVASFATVCVLTMIVIQRADEIAIMRSMGATAGAIRRIFVVQGMSIGISGIIMGLIIGLGLVAYLLYVGVPLDPSVYYIDRVPVELAAADVVRVTLGVLAISAFATLLPSLQASRLDPADALRHD